MRSTHSARFAVVLGVLACSSTSRLVAAREGGPSSDPPKVDLSRVGTVGALPGHPSAQATSAQVGTGTEEVDRRCPVIVLTIDAKGGLFVDAAVSETNRLVLGNVKWSELQGRLAAVTNYLSTSAPAPHPTYVVLRVDRAAPWATVSWVLQRLAADPKGTFRRVVFAVLPEEGTEEGGLALFLPSSHQPARTSPDAAPSLALAVQVRKSDADPKDLHARIRSAIPAGKGVGPATQARISADARVAAATVLRLADAALRAGVPAVLLDSVRFPWPPHQIDGAVTALLTDAPLPPGPSLSLSVGGREVPPLAAPPKAMAAVARSRALAGSLKPSFAWEEETVQVTPDDLVDKSR